MTVTNLNRLGDLVKWEVRREFSRIQLTWTVPAGGVILADPMGYPCIDNLDGTVTLALLATDGNTNCLLLHDTAINEAAAAVVVLTVLRYGPALYNQDLLPTLDTAGATFVQADVIAGLFSEHLHGVTEPAEITEQTA